MASVYWHSDFGVRVCCFMPFDLLGLLALPLQVGRVGSSRNAAAWVGYIPPDLVGTHIVWHLQMAKPGSLRVLSMLAANGPEQCTCKISPDLMGMHIVWHLQFKTAGAEPDAPQAF